MHPIYKYLGYNFIYEPFTNFLFLGHPSSCACFLLAHLFLEFLLVKIHPKVFESADIGLLQIKQQALQQNIKALESHSLPTPWQILTANNHDQPGKVDFGRQAHHIAIGSMGLVYLPT